MEQKNYKIIDKVEMLSINKDVHIEIDQMLCVVMYKDKFESHLRDSMGLEDQDVEIFLDSCIEYIYFLANDRVYEVEMLFKIENGLNFIIDMFNEYYNYILSFNRNDENLHMFNFIECYLTSDKDLNIEFDKFYNSIYCKVKHKKISYEKLKEIFIDYMDDYKC